MSFLFAVLLTFPGVLSAQPAFETNVEMIFTAGTPPVLYAGWPLGPSGSALFRSADDGATWLPVYLSEPGTIQPPVRSLVIDPTNPSILFLATDPAHGSIRRSTNSGVTWSNSNGGLAADDNDVQSLFVLRSNRFRMYARTARSLYKSVDAGSTWSWQCTLPAEAAAFTINAGDPSHMYLGTAAGAIYHTIDEGVSWARSGALTLNYNNSKDDLEDLVSAPMNPRLLFAAVRGRLLWVDSGGGPQYISGLHWSQDFGATWTNLAPGAQPEFIYPDPAGRTIVYYTAPESAKVCKTLALGSGSWNCVSLPNLYGAVRLSIQPSAPDTMYAATLVGIYKSTDGAATWRYLEGTVRPTLAKPDPLNFTLVAGTQGYRNLDLRILENWPWKVTVTAAASESWISLSAASVTTPDVLNVSVDTAGFAVGSYQGTIQLSAPNAANAPLSVPVRLTVIPPAARGPAYDLTTFAGTGKYGFSGDGGPALAAQLASPTGVTLDESGNVYIADTGNHRVRRVSRDGVIRTIAGTGQSGSAGDGGPATAAQLWRPQGVGAAGGNVYIGDTFNSSLRLINSAGMISTILGFFTPTPVRSPRGISIDPQGNVFLADPEIWKILKIGPSGGAWTAAHYVNEPSDVAVDPSGMLYIAETGAHRVIKVDANGNATTVAGTGQQGFDGDGGPATAAALSAPEGVAVDQAGQIYIADTGNHRVRVISPQGTIRTVAGTGTPGSVGSGGPAAGAQLNHPTDVVLDANGTLYVTDQGNNRVIQLALQAGSGPRISAGGIVHTASYTAEAAPGALFSIFGSELASGAAQAQEMPWPLKLAETSVTVNGRAAPLYYAGENQINAQLPYETSLGTAEVVVSNGETYTIPAPLRVIPAAPGIFQSSPGRAVAQNADWTVNGPANPAARGSVIVAYLTGLGLLDNPIATGAVAPMGILSRPVLPYSATLGGQPADVLFLGMTPGLVGLAQANVRVPLLPEGDYPLVLTIGTQSSQPALVAIGP